MRRVPRATLLIALLMAGVVGGCVGKSETEERAPLVVIGIDGAEWRVIEKLWEQGRLPNLKRLRDRGVAEHLLTQYAKSPVIWTTIATGVTAEKHGITDFLVPGDDRETLVSSEVREVPAIWNMLTAARRRVAVLGWWATWPSEAVHGVVISDRPLKRLERRVYPPSYLAPFEETAEAVLASPGPLSEAGVNGPKDQVIATSAVELAADGFDLMLIYFRAVDNMSHWYWKFYEPERFPPIGEDELARFEDRIPSAYQAVDEAIGEIVGTVGPKARIVVLSDHGFHAREGGEAVSFRVDLRPVLKKLGYSVARGGRVDSARTLIQPCGPPSRRSRIRLRISLPDEDEAKEDPTLRREAIVNRFRADLERITYASGASVFRLRTSSESQGETCGDLEVRVLRESPSRTLFFEGRPIENAIDDMRSISGGHEADSHGIFIAAGPGIDSEADISGISIVDVTPTLLFGLGLPVAEDFDGRARTELFTPSFRARHPLRTIETWSPALDTAGRTGVPDSTPGSSELAEELRALGYLD